VLPSTHLPEPLTSLVGREPEIHRIADLLGRPSTRHLTLTGPGGIGKTRLALRIAQSAGDDFPDGVSFIDLSSLSDPSLVPLAVASGVGLTPGDSVEAALIAHFADLSALLILDNFEHLLPAAALVPHLAAACPDLVILVTSRERLGTTGELVLPIEPLGLPRPEPAPSVSQVISSPAVQLFVERAAAVRPDFGLADDNAVDVAAICRRLDGIPLGIELAAARIAHLSPRTIASHVGQLLPLLTGGAPDAPARQRTMSHAVRWSYDLLEPAEQTLFCRLAVFAGGCTIEAATDVCGKRLADAAPDDRSVEVSTLLLLASLADKSLLRTTDRDGETRYRMLEPVREFGLVQLAARGEETAARRAHAEHLLAFADRARIDLSVHDPAAWIRRLNAEIDNFRAALRWLIDTAPAEDETALKICNELAHFWLWRGHWGEAKSWLTQALRQVGESTSEEVAHAYANLGHVEVGSARESFRCYERSLELFRRIEYERGILVVLSCLGMTAEQMGEYAAAKAYLEECLSRSEAQGSDYGIAQAAFHLGVVSGRMGEIEQGKEYLDRARGLWEQLESVADVAFTIIELGRLYRLQGRLEEATDLLDWSVARLEQTGISHAQGPAHYELGEVALAQGDRPRAAQQFREALRLLREANIIHIGFASAVEGLARIVQGRRPEPAVEAFAAIEAWQQRTGFRGSPSDERHRKRAIDENRRRLGESRFTIMWERGLRTSLTAAADSLVAVEIPLAETAPAASRRAGTDTEVDRLTRQELRVLCSIFEGMSNQQIADRLSITVRTAANHVTNILGKLSVDNRTQAAAVAFRNDLCPPPD
jgi:predicted ATPase